MVTDETLGRSTAAPAWNTMKRRCPDCGVWIVTAINYANQGWMEEGGYREAYCWPPDHTVHQPMYVDDRCDGVKVDCPTQDTVTRLRQSPVADELVPVEQLFDLQQELVEAQAIIENLHTYLYDAGMVFICGCDRQTCREMRVYFSTVKTNV